jgi:hypothetical protein
MTSEDLKVGDLLFWTLVIAFIAFVAYCTSGCASSDRDLPCPKPTPRIVQVERIAPCIIRVEPLERYVPPELPSYPGHDADDEELKAWALVLGEAIEAGRAVCLQREEAWQAKVEAHNASEPRCAEPVPTPPP